jgi:hypothetical protein
VHSNASGTLTINTMGSNVGETFAYSDLRVSNGSVELSISQACNAPYDWVQCNLRYYYCDPEEGTCNFQPISNLFSKKTINPYEGVFVWGNQDNITLVRRG